MVLATAFSNVCVEPCGRYNFASLLSRAFVIGEISRPSGACISAESWAFGWEVISNAPVGVASRSGLMGVVVYVVC